MGRMSCMIYVDLLCLYLPLAETLQVATSAKLAFFGVKGHVRTMVWLYIL